jgi:hypothetical protein
MIELILYAVVCGTMAKIAIFENFSGVLWGGITVAICVATLFLMPWPYLRVLAAGIASVGAMMVYKLVTGK